MLEPISLIVCRTDRLGDVMMALPSLSFLRNSLPNAKISFLCNTECAELLKPTLAKLDIETIETKKRTSSEWRVWWLEKKPTAALLLYPERALSLGAWKARIRWRVGPLSKLLSVVVLNAGKWQRRSQGEKNEAEYNLELAGHLLSCLGTYVPPEPAAITLSINEEARTKATQVLQSLNLSSTKYIVVHPGMGGSALNPSEFQYRSIIEAIQTKTGFPVVVTIGPAPKDQAMGKALESSQAKVIQNISLPVLLEIFRGATAVIAPSTGPIHLAHHSGTRTIGLYSPVKSHHPKRWAPWGGTGDSKVLVPQADCPATKECLGPKCSVFDCMDTFPWAEKVSDLFR